MQLKKTNELAHGAAILEAGNSGKKEGGYHTGAWRVRRPILDKEKCINCMFCWAYCPDTSIVIDKEKSETKGMDLDFCKGCGLCAAVCPSKCITMKDEKEFTNKGDKTTCVFYKSENKFNDKPFRWNE